MISIPHMRLNLLNRYEGASKNLLETRQGKCLWVGERGHKNCIRIGTGELIRTAARITP